MDWDTLKAECLACRRCELCTDRTYVVFGQGVQTAEVLFVGEGPGQSEDEQGLPFVGRSGQLLDKYLFAIDLDRSKNCYIANIVKCRPPHNRDPLPTESEACMPWLREQFKLLQPKIVVCLGRIASQRMIRTDFSVTKEHGTFVQKNGVWFMGTFHPAALLRQAQNKPASVQVSSSFIFAYPKAKVRCSDMKTIQSRSPDFFLGATTPAGFKGYFEPLRREPGMQMLLIKSGPGCGKSTLMKHLAQAAEQQGQRIEKIHCASDPDSLDGVIFLDQKRAIIDATAPHVVEPDAPGADELVVSLYHTIDAGKLAPHRDEVKALFARNAALRGRAARYIASAGSLMLDSRRAEACSANFEKVRRYVKRLCTRLLPRTEGTASEELRLLSAITPKGMVFYRGTVEALADRYVVFRDDYGAVSRLLLELIRAEALARGYHIITCPCAMHPEDQIDHIFIPALRLAFLTDNLWHPIQLPGVQAVRCTRFVDRENLSGFRARLRFNDRAASELIDQAVALMAQAKNCHDELETYYRAAVDFDQVNAVAANCQKILSLG